MSNFHEQNRASWNHATAIHNAHKQDQAAFLRGGGSTLFREELELAGDLAGKRVLHLQCNSGQDSLSLAALGARVTGVDISDVAIDFATSLARDSHIDASFERDDIAHWLPRAAARGDEFDLVFSTYGTIGWIADLSAWAHGTASVLAPDGALVLLEFHPLVWCLDRDGRRIDDYFRRGPIHEPEGVRDYVAASGDALTPSGRVPAIAASGDDFVNPAASVAFQWTVADIVQAVVDAGLSIEILREYPYSNGCRIWDTQVELPGRRFGLPGNGLPLMIGLRARRANFTDT